MGQQKIKDFLSCARLRLGNNPRFVLAIAGFSPDSKNTTNDADATGDAPCGMSHRAFATAKDRLPSLLAVFLQVNS